jgi:hypothetical protein
LAAATEDQRVGADVEGGVADAGDEVEGVEVVLGVFWTWPSVT